MSEHDHPPYFESLPPGTEWDAYEKEGWPTLWIPRMLNDNPLPADVAEYCINQLLADLDDLKGKIVQN